MHFETGREGEIVVGEEGGNGGYTNVGLKRENNERLHRGILRRMVSRQKWKGSPMTSRIHRGRMLDGAL